MPFYVTAALRAFCPSGLAALVDYKAMSYFPGWCARAHGRRRAGAGDETTGDLRADIAMCAESQVDKSARAEPDRRLARRQRAGQTSARLPMRTEPQTPRPRASL